MWGPVRVVDDGGKITGRHQAFFVGDDGSQFQAGYISTNPVRMIMEFDDISPNFSSVSLILGSERIQSVPITPVDGNQPAGSIPARAAAGQPARGTQAASSGALDKTQQGINNINTKQQQMKAVLDSMKSTAQSNKQ